MQINRVNIAAMDKRKKQLEGIPDLGKRLRLFRKSFGYSAQGLSEHIRSQHEDSTITRQVIFNIENGRKTDLTITELVYISDAMGLPYTALLCDLTEPFRIIKSGPFNNKTNYGVIEKFDPQKNELAVNENWFSLNCYLDPAIELMKNIDQFDFSKSILVRNQRGEQLSDSKAALITMKAALSYMEADLQDLKDLGAYVPEEYINKVDEAKIEYKAFESEFSD